MKTPETIKAEWIADKEVITGEEFDQRLNRRIVEIQSDARADLEERVARLETAFRHMHVNNQCDDACAKCGLDLRDAIHQRSAIAQEKGQA